jgi:hypothetical protein
VTTNWTPTNRAPVVAPRRGPTAMIASASGYLSVGITDPFVRGSHTVCVLGLSSGAIRAAPLRVG